MKISSKTGVLALFIGSITAGSLSNNVWTRYVFRFNRNTNKFPKWTGTQFINVMKIPAVEHGQVIFQMEKQELLQISLEINSSGQVTGDIEWLKH